MCTKLTFCTSYYVSNLLGRVVAKKSGRERTAYSTLPSAPWEAEYEHNKLVTIDPQSIFLCYYILGVGEVTEGKNEIKVIHFA